MSFKTTQASLPNHTALALVVLGTLLATCMASGKLVPATDSFGGVDIATSVKRQLRTRTYTTNDIPNNDRKRMLMLTFGGVPEPLWGTIGRTNEWIGYKDQGILDVKLFEEIKNCINNGKTPTMALKMMDLTDEKGHLALDNPATAKYEEFVERYLQETNSPKSAIDVILDAYIRSDPNPHNFQFLIKRLKGANDISGTDSFGGRLYKAQLNAWREKEPNVVANELRLHIQNPYFEPEALIIWLDYLGLHLNLPTLENGYDDARNSILRIFRETFGEGPNMLRGVDQRLDRELDVYLLGWRQALQSGDNLKAYASKKLAPLDSKAVPEVPSRR